MSRSGTGEVFCFFRLVRGTGTGKPLTGAGGGTQLMRWSCCFLDGMYVRGGSGGLDIGDLSSADDENIRRKRGMLDSGELLPDDEVCMIFGDWDGFRLI